RALGNPPAARRALDLAAPLQGLLVAPLAEVRDPRLPPARLLLCPRHPDVDRRLCARRRGSRAARPRKRHHRGDDRARRAAPDLRVAVHAVRDVVRHGIEQGAALESFPPPLRQARRRQGSLMRGVRGWGRAGGWPPRLLIVGCALTASIAAAPTATLATAPGTAGVPQAPTQVFFEDF